MKTVYMDNAATTPVDEEVLKEMLPYFSEKYGNASSLHSMGQEAAEALYLARERAARLINADSEEIIFTSGGSESDNAALKEIMFKNRDKGNHLITSRIEHPAVLRTAEFLEKMGFSVTYLDVDKTGSVNPLDVKKAVTKNTVLVSIMHANNEIGTIQPIEEISKICKENKILFHTDAVQTVGKLPIDVKRMQIDLLSASSHKLHGPKGVGFLYVKKGTRIGSLIHGGSHEFGKRAGTENIAGIVGFGKACEIAAAGLKKNHEYLSGLRNRLMDGVLKNIARSYLNGDREKRLPNNVHFRFDFIEGEALLLHLDGKEICASTGSACSTKSLKPSHVLTALGLKPVQAHGSLRLTLSKYNTPEDIDKVIKVLPPIICNLRKISPLNEKNINDDFPDDKCGH
ncbi:cysteine desulfurase NifS [Candidatus Woesearchaeota archaeon]|nr:cysteine desulfurase NifS [Candidatus Woesearchaeota archaeon]